MKASFKSFEVTAETLFGIDIFAGLDTASRETIAKLCEGRRFDTSSWNTWGAPWWSTTSPLSSI